MEPYVKVDNVSLRFRLYRNRHPNLKEAVIHWLRGASANAGGDGTSEHQGSGSSYSEFWALKDVSLDFAAGSRVGIVGRNGAGKSTLLRVISGIYRPTTGRVSHEGFLIPIFTVGFGFNGELTGRENILQAGAIMGITPRQMLRRVESIMQFAELEKFIDTPVKYYSTGMAMRLAFTTATEVSPDILLLDEVFGGGDAGFQEKALKRLEALIERTKVVIMVSHDMSIIERFCNRAVWIRDGHLAADGLPREVIASYLAATAEPVAAG